MAVCNAMLFMGIAHAGFNSVNQALLEKWLTPSEKKPFSFLVYGGTSMLTFLRRTNLIHHFQHEWY